MRIKNSLLNMSTSFIGQTITTGLSFVTRTIFIQTLGLVYLGINGLIGNILVLLSLAELGLATAIIYNLYKPIADNDIETLKSLMKLFNKAFKIIGIVITGLGLCLLPFLPYFMGDSPNITHLNLIYILFLVNSVISYFYAHKVQFVIANQKNYIITIVNNITLFLLNIIQIIILLVYKDFILYLIVQIVATFVQNFIGAKIADRMYPFLKEKNVKRLENSNIIKIKNDIKSLFFHRIGGVIINATDNIMISTFVGVVFVGLFSNYQLVINIVSLFLLQLLSSLTASIGNLNAISSKETSYKIFNVLYVSSFYIYAFVSICLYILLNPFVTWWLGPEYVLSKWFIIVFVANFYVRTMRRFVLTFRDTVGLFEKDKYKSIIEAILNLVLSIILVQYFGLIGVLLGTLISSLLCFWIEPYIVYKYFLNQSLKQFFVKYIVYFLILCAALISVEMLTGYIQTTGLIGLFVKFILCFLIVNIIFLLCFWKTKEFSYLLSVANSLFNRKKGLHKSNDS